MFSTTFDVSEFTYRLTLYIFIIYILEARPVEKVECPQKRRYRIIILSQVPKPDDEVERAEWPYQRLP